MTTSISIKNAAIRVWVAASVILCAAFLISSFETQKAKAQGVSIGVGGRFGGILFDLTPRSRNHVPLDEPYAAPPKKSRKRTGATRKKSRRSRGNIYNVSRGEKKRIQHALNILGCDAGAVDGRKGRKTREAVKRFQLVLDHNDTGYLSAEEKTVLFTQSDELQVLTKLLVDEKIELSSKFVPIMCGLDTDQGPRLEMTNSEGVTEEPVATGNITILPDAVPLALAAEDAATPPSEIIRAAEAWYLVKDADSTAILEAYVELYGNSTYADLARIKLDKLRQAKIN